MPINKQCAVCGQSFSVKPSHAPLRRTCSRACMAKDYQERMRGASNPHYTQASLRVCEGCGEQYHSYQKTRRYCSRKCYEENSPARAAFFQRLADRSAVRKANPVQRKRKPRPPRPPKHRTCVKCGASFRAVGSSLLCYDCTHMQTHCCVCGAVFESRSARVKRTCSEQCHRDWKSIRQRGSRSHRWQGGKTSESTLLRTCHTYADWRAKVMARDDYTCALCGQRGGRLAVHHIKLFSEHPGKRLDKDNGITLCWKCHGSIRGKEARYERQFEKLLERE